MSELTRRLRSDVCRDPCDHIVCQDYIDAADENDRLAGAIKFVVESGSKGFVTCNSGDEYKVVAKFKTLTEAQAFYVSLANLKKALAPAEPTP